MLTPAQLIHGVEGIWFVWLLAVAVVLKMLLHAVRRWRRPCWGELARGEEGLSYSLSYVMVIPFCLLFVCLVFETTWLLMAKIGTLYAAHAGARSQVVWSSAQPASLRTTRTNQSVWTAMTPFVTGYTGAHMPPLESFLQAGEYTAAYRTHLSRGDPYANAPNSTLSNRYLNAAARTSWQVRIDTSRADGDLTVTVTYRAPLHIPGIARIFAPRSQPPSEYPITSSATLPNEAPASADGTLGIEYQSR